MSSATNLTVDHGGGTTAITSVHPDIIRTHILTRLDGQTLISTSCASRHLRPLSQDDKFWSDVCNSTWPSTASSLVRDAVSTFPSGHRSFFSDSFPSLNHFKMSKPIGRRSPSETSEFISAVDIHCENKLICSKTVVTETTSGWFRCSPFRIDLLETKETVPTSLKFVADERSLTEIAETMSLSWILIDPNRKRAVNLSSLRPVMVRQHWLTGSIVVRYATIMDGGNFCSGSPDLVQCKLEITCGGKEGGKLQIKEVGMQLEDMDDGKSLNGKDSLAILQDAMDGERRKSGEERKRYEEYEALRREIREIKQRSERRQDMMCVAMGVTIFMAFWAFVLLR